MKNVGRSDKIVRYILGIAILGSDSLCDNFNIKTNS